MNTIRISTGTMLRVLLIIGAVYVLSMLGDLLISLLVAVVIASSVEPFTKLLAKYKVPRSVSVGFVFILVISILLGGTAFIIPKVADDIVAFIKRLPAMLDNVQDIQILGRGLGLNDMTAYLNDLSKNISSGQIVDIFKNFTTGAGSAVHATSVVINNVANLVIMLVLSFYLAVEKNGVQNFLRVITPKRYETYIIDLWDRSQNKISSWAQGQLLLGVILSVMVYVAMLVIGVPYAALLAVIAFVGELIPIVGMTLAMIPAVLLALSSGGWSLAGITFVTYFIIGQIENHILYPKVMNKMVGVPSVVVIIALIIGAKLAGFWGIVLAVPVASIFLELLSDIDSRKLPREEVD